jgi:DNA-binding NarL/FixJ family response regulator
MTNPIKTLVVDDHILFREGLISLLNDKPDFQAVGGAGSVQEAIRLSGETGPELILMDTILPDGTGLEATQAILARNPSVQIILTVHETDEIQYAPAGSGVKGYIRKNTTTSKVLEMLRRLMRGEPTIQLNSGGHPAGALALF